MVNRIRGDDMTVQNTNRRNDYTGNGATDTYDYTFRIFDDADLLVTVRDTDDIETVLALGDDYTVTGAGDAGGGSITLTAGNLADGYKLTLRLNVAMLQETDYRNQGAFFAETVETALDRVTMISLRQQDEIDRSLKLPETVVGVSTSLPVPAALKVLRWNSDGDGIENVALGSTELAVPADASVTPAKLSDITPATNLLPYLSSSTTWATTTLTAAGRALLDDADAAAQRTTLGLGTVAVENTVPVAKGGTGQTTAAGAFDAIKQDATTSATGVVELATSAETKTGTDAGRVAPVGTIKHHAGVAKAWVYFTISGGVPSIQASENVTDITDNGVGDYTITFTTPFANTNFAAVAMVRDTSTTVGIAYEFARTTGSVRIKTSYGNTNPSSVDQAAVSVIVFGHQV
jgi:hypothetical protein